MCICTYHRGHAAGLVDGTAAAEERNQKDDRAEHDANDGGHVHLLQLLVGAADVAQLQNGGHTEGQNGDAAKLEWKCTKQNVPVKVFDESSHPNAS